MTRSILALAAAFRAFLNSHRALPKVQCSKFNVQSSMFKVQCSKFNVQSSKFKVQSSMFNVQCSTFHFSSPLTRLSLQLDFDHVVRGSVSGREFMLGRSRCAAFTF